MPRSRILIMAGENNTSTSDESRYAPKLAHKRRKADQFSRNTLTTKQQPQNTPGLRSWGNGSEGGYAPRPFASLPPRMVRALRLMCLLTAAIKLSLRRKMDVRPQGWGSRVCTGPEGSVGSRLPRLHPNVRAWVACLEQLLLIVQVE